MGHQFLLAWMRSSVEREMLEAEGAWELAGAVELALADAPIFEQRNDANNKNATTEPRPRGLRANTF